MMAGLKPYERYKDSGVQSLGNIPSHWDVRRQRNVVRLLVSNVDKHTLPGEITVRLCNYVDVYKNDRITEHLHFMTASASQAEIDRFLLKREDVVITKDSESWNDIGVPALIEYVAPDFVCGYHLAILRPRTEVICGDYLFRATLSHGVSYQYQVLSTGVTRYGLSYDAIKKVVLPIPPLEEQRTIARFLDYADARISKLFQLYRRIAGVSKFTTDRKTSLLFEYRTKLITDIVTGKFDVREAASRLPKEVEKLELIGGLDLIGVDDTDDETKLDAFLTEVTNADN